MCNLSGRGTVYVPTVDDAVADRRRAYDTVTRLIVVMTPEIGREATTVMDNAVGDLVATTQLEILSRLVAVMRDIVDGPVGVFVAPEP
jgi:hypothetical protein